MQITIQPRMYLVRLPSHALISLLAVLTCCSLFSNGDIVGLKHNKPLGERDLRALEDYLKVCDLKVITELLQGNIQLPESWCALPLIKKLCKDKPKAMALRKMKEEKEQLRGVIVAGLTKVIKACGVEFVIALLEGKIKLPTSWCEIPIVKKLCNKMLKRYVQKNMVVDMAENDWSDSPFEQRCNSSNTGSIDG